MSAARTVSTLSLVKISFRTIPFMIQRFLRLLVAALLIFGASHALAQTPQFRSSSTLNGSGTLSFPAGSVSSDWLVMSVISAAAVSAPAGWTQTVAYNWTVYGYRSYIFTRQKGSDNSVAISTSYGGAYISAYQNTTGIGAVGTFAESAATANSLTLNGITPQNAFSLVLGIVTDRDVVVPTPAAGFTSRVGFNMSYFGNNLAEKAYGTNAPTGSAVWGQHAYYPAAGVMIELLPPAPVAPTITNAFSPASMAVGGVTTLTFTIANPNGLALTNVNFTDTLSNMTVANTAIGGTCSSVSNSPALTVGATQLNLTIPSLPMGGCTITVQVTSNTAGSHNNATSGATSTQTPAAGAASNTATLTVTANPVPPVLTQAFVPAWMAPGSTSTLIFTLTSPSSVALSNVHFTDTLANMTVANATLGGTCTGVSNSPSLTVGATALNLTIATVPVAGCTLSVQVTSATLGSNANTPSGATSTESLTTGAAPATIYLTVQVDDADFYYVHADHLGTPRAITRPSDNAKVWVYENTEPFGNSLPNENPSGFGNFEFNQVFPGQYRDKETGTSYNYFRDYDPSTGRYVQSDPIGLGGGLSTYSYVSANPLELFDEFGLAACSYSIASRRLSCIPSKPGGNRTTATLGWPGLFSGTGSCQNNPSKECQDQKKGPIPEGDYDILPYDGNLPNWGDWWRLRPKSNIRRVVDGLNLGRGGGYLLHPGRFSYGCITYRKTNEDDNSYKLLNELLKKEKGYNSLTVTP
jgi:RHS repeat-associated protein